MNKHEVREKLDEALGKASEVVDDETWGTSPEAQNQMMKLMNIGR